MKIADLSQDEREFLDIMHDLKAADSPSYFALAAVVIPAGERANFFTEEEMEIAKTQLRHWQEETDEETVRFVRNLKDRIEEVLAWEGVKNRKQNGKHTR